MGIDIFKPIEVLPIGLEHIRHFDTSWRDARINHSLITVKWADGSGVLEDLVLSGRVRNTKDSTRIEQSEKSQPADPVNHPPHYTEHPSGVECIVIAEHFSFCVGNAIKYLWRAGLKGDEVEDLKKASWYINREIGRRSLKQ